VIDLPGLLRSASDLEPLPPSAARLARLVAESDPDLGAIVDALDFDPVLTARVLSAANSAAVRGREPVSTLRGAVVRLGIGPTLGLVLAVLLRGRLRGAVPGYGLGEDELWRHSVASALAAQGLAEQVPGAVPPEAFAAALLHDVGKVVLGRFLEPELLRELRRVTAGATPSTAAEAGLLGVDHGEVGGLVARHWKLPDGIVLGIAFHHRPGEVSTALVDAVHVADALAKPVTEPGRDPVSDPALDAAAGARLGLDAEGLRSVSASVVREFAERETLYGGARRAEAVRE
jgi:HD-like signal output (HDOD) protein